MNRRSFLTGSFLSGAAANAATERPITPPAIKLAFRRISAHQFMMNHGDGKSFPIVMPSGNWQLMWTGWKESIAHAERVGQWIATWDGKEPYMHHMVYVSTPGSWGAFSQGEHFNIDTRFPQMRGRWRSEEDMREDKSHALDAMLELIRVYDWEFDRSQPFQYWKSWAEKKALTTCSDRAKFYLDCTSLGFNSLFEGDVEEWRRLNQTAKAYGFPGVIE